MRRMEKLDLKGRAIVTYELADGQWIDLDARAVAEFGAERLIRDAGYGHLLETERVAVFQHGRKIGTVPPNFEPMNIKSNTFLYDVRPGDFTRDGDKWIASRTLGPGDLEAVPGFVRVPRPSPEDSRAGIDNKRG